MTNLYNKMKVFLKSHLVGVVCSKANKKASSGMFNFKRRVIVNTVSIIAFLIFTYCLPVGAITPISIGDYVKMGKYHNSELLWRCVDIDKTGVLMLSDKVIATKAFDADGIHKNDSKNIRMQYGSNMWFVSNIKSWLNSYENAGKVKWLCGNPPSSSHLYGNPYSDESGFLNEINFTTKEIGLLRLVPLKHIINSADFSYDSEGIEGGQRLLYNAIIGTEDNNFDSSYGVFAKERMFLPDVQQISAIYDNLSILGENYLLGYPTDDVLNQGTNVMLDEEKGTLPYWLRTPAASGNYPEFSLAVSTNQYIDVENVKNGYVGVRPSFYLDFENSSIISGDGSKDNPFCLDSRSYIEAKSNGPIITSYTHNMEIDSSSKIYFAAYGLKNELEKVVEFQNTSGFESEFRGVGKKQFDLSGLNQPPSIKGFLWNNFNNIKPLSNSFPIKNIVSLSLPNEIIVDFTATDCLGGPLLIKAEVNGEIVYLNTIFEYGTIYRFYLNENLFEGDNLKVTLSGAINKEAQFAVGSH